MSLLRNNKHTKSALEGHTSNAMEGHVNNLLVKETEMPNIRPAIDALNYLLAKSRINQIQKEQLGRKNMYYSTPSLSVRPIQDLSPEILASQADARSMIRSEYAGSDPVMNTLNKAIAAAQRARLYNEQIVERAGNLASERGRWDQQTRENQQLAAETEAKNLDRAQDFADYRVGVNTAALEAKKDLNASVLSQIGKNIDTAAQFNLEAEAIERANKRTEFNDKLRMAQLEPNEGIRRGLIAEAQKSYDRYTAQPISTYGQAQAKAISTRLLPKRWRNLGRY